MKFGDFVIAVVSMVVIFGLLAFPLDFVFVSILGFGSYEVGVFVALFLSALIGGFIFAEKIGEARRENVTKVTILWAALMMLFAAVVPASVGHWQTAAQEELNAMYPDTTLSTAEWTNWEMIYLDGFMFLIVALTLVLGFTGLYLGSRLR
ncbi:MAG: hypothetical protein JSV35_00235 [Candidatus Bathyarchaeota archaeon]|nr:MAG: hypothetical protein JSV35_00235 [Candidatus Bathyarchaeota archaeon]